MIYVDGFVLPLAKDKLDAYRAIAQGAGNIWMEHGALAYKELAADDMKAENMVAFPAMIGAAENETVILAYIVYNNRAHRDEVNAKVMADERLHALCDPNNMPFDCKRMAYGGFSAIVDL